MAELIIGGSPAIQALRGRLERLLRQLATVQRQPVVLLEGETGTGKGLVAKQLHRSGPRAEGPFVDVNCAAIPESLLEAEFFGFERGAFTDARQAKLGLFQAAHGGTLFLDEVGLLPLGLQAKLLKVLEERTVRRLGSTQTTPVDVWIIAASNEDLRAGVRAGRVREDFYHRIGRLILHLPPLRQRGEDICLLAEHFLARACTEYGLLPKRLSSDALAALRGHLWPGNVRELDNVIERAVLLVDGQEITAHQLGLSTPSSVEPALLLPVSGTVLRETVDQFERQQLLTALEETHWNISFAADRLGVPRNTLRYRMARYGLRPTGPPRRRRRMTKAVQRDDPASVVPSVAKEKGSRSTRLERRQIAWFQVVVQGSPSVGAAPTARACELVVEKIESFGGLIQKLSPDRIVAAFGLEPSEDALRRASYAGLAICKAMARGELQVRVRPSLIVTVHTMPAVIEEEPDGVRSLAAESREAGCEELIALSPGEPINEVLASSAVAPMLERWFQLEVVTGHPGSSYGPIYRVVRRQLNTFGAGPARRLSLFVGRDGEIRWLQARLSQLRTGRGQVVGIVAEPGAGKSRLVNEFRERLSGSHVQYFEGACSSYGSGVPYLPVIDLLRRVWALDELEDPEATGEIIRRRLEASGLSATEAPIVLRLFGIASGSEELSGLSPETIKRRTFDVIRHVVLRQGEPVVLTVEDLHWVDKTSEDFFGSIADSTLEAPILFLTTYRPGYRPPWVDRSYVSKLTLAPLSRSDSRLVVGNVLRGEAVSATVSDAILARAEGNPFFLEELALAAVSPAACGFLSSVPPTINGVLTARIERLSGTLQRVLEAAAVLGREGSVGLLDEVLRIPDLVTRVQDLVELEFFYWRMEAGGRRYSFRHALIQEVAYARLTEANRATLHAAAAQAIETLYYDRLDEQVDRLTYHYAKTTNTVKAITYVIRFSEKAVAGYAAREATEALLAALDRVAALEPSDEHARLLVRVICALGLPLGLLGRFAESTEVFEQRQGLVEGLRDPSLASSYYFWLALNYSHLGNQALAATNAQRAIEAASHCNDANVLGASHYVLALECFWLGNTRKGVEHALQAITLLERENGSHFFLGPSYWILGQYHALQGNIDRAYEASEVLLVLSRKAGDPRLESYALRIRGWVYTMQGDWPMAIKTCRASLERAPDPTLKASAGLFLGYAHLEAGDPHAAIPLLELAVEDFRRFQFKALESWGSAWLGEAQIGLATSGQGRVLSQALTKAKDVGFPYARGLAERALGRYLFAVDDARLAAKHFLDAVESFESLEATYEVARTYLDLAQTTDRLGDRRGAVRYAQLAHGLFARLNIPIYTEESKKLERRYLRLLE